VAYATIIIRTAIFEIPRGSLLGLRAPICRPVFLNTFMSSHSQQLLQQLLPQALPVCVLAGDMLSTRAG